NAAAIRHTLWLQTDLRYKQALAAFLKMKGQRVYEAESEPERPSFSRAPAIVRAEPLLPLDVDRARWERLARAAAARLDAFEGLLDSEVQIEHQVETRWIVNTEGARVRTTPPIHAFHVAANARADDGMLLDHSAD